jgi:hypothetical protein
MFKIYRFFPVVGILMAAKVAAQWSEGGLPPSFLPENVLAFEVAGPLQIIAWQKMLSIPKEAALPYRLQRR